MKFCPNCQNKYPDDANFCPREGCASAVGPSRLVPVEDEAAARFAPVTRIGGGRTGEVWQAQDAQTGETVAYKLVAPAALPTPPVLERAQRELKQLQRSQSPRIARVIDCGKTADGRLFVASELCAGESLDTLVAKGGALPLDRAKKIIAQIGEALLEGQKVGVVHHDLSPKNVLVDAQDQVKVINFSVAQPVTDRVFGVPEFVSPEQAEGKPADQRSNTYSLGAIAVFLLTGAPPFSGASPEAVLEQVLRGEVTPPSQRAAELTPDIDRILLRAMDRNSSRRPLTLRQFLGEVAAMHLAGAPAPAVARPALNRTIAYAGGAPEVRRLVAEATAARAEANGSGPVVAYSPVSAAPAAAVAAAAAPVAPRVEASPAPVASRPSPEPAAQPTPPPVAHRNHGAAVAATMVAMPAAAPAVLGVPIPDGRGPAAVDAHSQPTPPPVAVVRPAEAPVARNAAPAADAGAQGGQTGNFRETLWFKKGDVEQMVAEAKAKVAAAGAKHRETPSAGHELLAEDGKPLEDRYVDDGSLTVEDRNKFSLSSGRTSAPRPAASSLPTGDRMSAHEMLSEIDGGKKIKVIAIAVVAVVVVVAALFFTLRGKGSEKPAAPPSAAAVAPPPVEPAAPAPAARAGEAAAPGAAAGEESPPARVKDGAPGGAPTKARAAKKKPAKRTQGKKKR